MKLPLQQISELLKATKQNGIIVIDGLPHEVTLTIDGDITLTGGTWRWEETLAPSAHGDYVVEADELMKTSISELPEIQEEETYDFYNTVDDYLNMSK
ncbi:hypothetical protein IM538_09390 [Cytobacillus suaedae]|nr:hypothetical protein IM538_09390 [Cytobacillus suaedae]